MPLVLDGRSSREGDVNYGACNWEHCVVKACIMQPGEVVVPNYVERLDSDPYFCSTVAGSKKERSEVG